MHKSGLGGIIIDCWTDDLDSDAKFWGAALGLEPVPSDPGYIGLATPDGRPDIEVQAVDHESRVHLDIKTDDVQAEVARLLALGAREIVCIRHWVVMEAPSGHRFCVVPLHPGEDRGELNAWGDV